jgi:hypothetical protein
MAAAISGCISFRTVLICSTKFYLSYSVSSRLAYLLLASEGLYSSIAVELFFGSYSDLSLGI